MKAFLASSKTNLIAALLIVCGGTNYAELIPPKYNSLLMLGCGVLTAFGFLVAKDANVTNSPKPVVAHVIPDEAALPPAPPIPAKVP